MVLQAENGNGILVLFKSRDVTRTLSVFWEQTKIVQEKSAMAFSLMDLLFEIHSLVGRLDLNNHEQSLNSKIHLHICTCLSMINHNGDIQEIVPVLMSFM